MTIDDPLSAAVDRLKADELSRSPDLARDMASRVAEWLPSPFSDVVKSVLMKNETEKLSYLLEILQQEFVHERENILRLATENGEFRRFLGDEYPSLLAEGFRKARTTRVQSRITRIAAILTNAVLNPTPSPADEIEEFMNIATQLSDLDVTVLGIVRKLQGNVVTGDGQRLSGLSWADAGLDKLGIGVPEVFSSAPKLESFGLIRQTDEYRRFQGSPKPWPYALLPKGSRFIAFSTMPERSLGSLPSYARSPQG